jgi:hypothetical protein
MVLDIVWARWWGLWLFGMRAIWEKIWEQNAVKPPRIGAMRRDEPDTRMALTCALIPGEHRKTPGT